MANTKHKADCNMAFGRKDATCPRCIELLNGAQPIKWNVNAARKAGDAEVRAIKAHFNSEKHRTGGCGVVCTFGDW